ncbi:hypothetical protein K438DRAFT_1966515 [Mycena galopus ATCC 62051]|nr:hypothetical protein K438DRAFT_1966515 [Mycena galopus ATCC 62051]
MSLRLVFRAKRGSNTLTIILPTAATSSSTEYAASSSCTTTSPQSTSVSPFCWAPLTLVKLALREEMYLEACDMFSGAGTAIHSNRSAAEFYMHCIQYAYSVFLVT